MLRSSRVGLALLAALSAMACAIVGLLIFVYASVSRIEAASRLITEDTAPSIIELEATNAAVADLRAALEVRLRSPGENVGEIATASRAVNESAARYLALPVDPGEAELGDRLRLRLVDLEDLRRRIEETTAATPVAAREALRDELDAAVRALSRVLVAASHLNANLAYGAVEDLRGVGNRLVHVVLGFELASLGAAIAAVVLAYGMARHESERLAELDRKNAELESFSGRVAHDLMSPLMTVAMALGLAERCARATDDERLQTALARSLGTLDRVRRTTSDLLEFARSSTAPVPGRTLVAPFLQGLVDECQPIAAEAGVELLLVLRSRRAVSCTSGVLTSIVSNLVQNAIRYTKGTARGQVHVRAMDEGRIVRFEVEDTGPGIAPEDRDAIFAPFVRRSDTGAGLGIGLATVKRLAEAYGGEVGVRSELGQGALFWVKLPAVA